MPPSEAPDETAAEASKPAPHASAAGAPGRTVSASPAEASEAALHASAAGAPNEPPALSQADRLTWQALRAWLQRDDEGRALLARIGAAPEGAAEALDDWLRRRAVEAPPRVATYVSGGRVDTLVNIAQAGVVHLPPAPPPSTPAARRAQRDRVRMLARVRRTWVAGVLEDSLHGAPLQALGLEARPEAVPDRWESVAQEAQEEARLLPPGTGIADVFDGPDGFDGELLILGAPGAGKTTLLLELARELLDRAEDDEALPLPVVFPLSTWATRRPPLAEWLTGELVERYDVPRAVAAAWVGEGQILPLLDGLDEVRAEHREACVEAINAFRAGPREDLGGLVVCSREAEYEALTSRLRLRGAVLLRPLSPEQVDAYLAGAGDDLAALRVAVRRDATLKELAASPLLLSLMALTYGGTVPTPSRVARSAGSTQAGAPGAALPAGGGAEDRRTELFAAYVERMFARRGAGGRYPRERTVRWLAWLAGALSRQAQTVFYLERLQPDWLPPADRWRYALLDRLGAGVAVALLAALVAALAGALPVAAPPGALGASMGAGPEGLIFALLAGAVAGLFGGRGETRHHRASPGAGLGWADLRGVVRRGVVGWLSTGLVAGTVAALAEGVTGAGGAAGAGGGGAGRELQETLVRNGLPEALAIGLTGAPGGALLIGLGAGLVFGLAGALAAALAGGPDVRPRRVTVVETLRWSPARAAPSAFGGVVAGLLIVAPIALFSGAVAGVVAGLSFGPLSGALLGAIIGALTGLVFGAYSAFHFGLLFGVVGGLVSGEFPVRAAPNQGIHRSARTAALVGLGTGLLYVLAVSLSNGVLLALLSGVDGRPAADLLPAVPWLLLVSVPGGLLYALIGGLAYGGYALLSHASLRLALWRTGALPLDCVPFLDYAAERVLLRKVGGGYLFVHRLLQEHFAALQDSESPAPSRTPTMVGRA